MEALLYSPGNSSMFVAHRSSFVVSHGKGGTTLAWLVGTAFTGTAAAAAAALPPSLPPPAVDKNCCRSWFAAASFASSPLGLLK